MSDALPELLTRCSAVYASLYHQPHDSDTRACYRALISELGRQFALLSAFVDVRFTSDDPYLSSTLMFTDIELNQRLYVYNVAELPLAHPLAQVHPNGQTYNTIFRAVHDGLAHFPQCNKFTYTGEFWAFRAHCDLMRGNVRAMRALATETLGQNAWFNFGPRSSERPRPFAPQIAAAFPAGTLADALMFPLMRRAEARYA